MKSAFSSLLSLAALIAGIGSITPARADSGYAAARAAKGPACHAGLLGDDHLAHLAPLAHCGHAARDWASDRILRGGAPMSAEAIDCLKAQGVTTILSLRQPLEDAAAQAESEWARSRGIELVSLPMDGHPSPAQASATLASNRRAVEAALDTIERVLATPGGGKIYIHCAAGEERTGLVIAELRIRHQSCSSPAARVEVRAEMLEYGYSADANGLEPLWKEL